MKPEFDLNEDGTVKFQTLTDFQVASVATIAVMLQIEYSETPAALETGNTERKQFSLYPQDALRLAEALQRVAGPLLGPLPLGNLLQ